MSQSVESAASFLITHHLVVVGLPRIMLRCCTKSSAAQDPQMTEVSAVVRCVTEKQVVTRFQGMSTAVLYHCALRVFLQRRSIQPGLSRRKSWSWIRRSVRQIGELPRLHLLLLSPGASRNQVQGGQTSTQSELCSAYPRPHLKFAPRYDPSFPYPSLLHTPFFHFAPLINILFQGTP